MRIPKGFSLSFFKGRYNCHPEPDSPGCGQLDSPGLCSSQLCQPSFPNNAFQTQLSKYRILQFCELSFAHSASKILLFEFSHPILYFQTELSERSLADTAFQCHLSKLAFRMQLPKLSFPSLASHLSSLQQSSEFGSRWNQGTLLGFV